MTYATENELIARFGERELIQLTDRDNGGAIDDTVLNRALADADAEINAYISGRYPLPLATVPDIIKQVAADITRYRLYADRATEEVRQRYKDAITLLTRISTGVATLGAVPANEPPGGEVIGDDILIEGGPERVFGRGRMGDP